MSVIDTIRKSYDPELAKLLIGDYVVWTGSGLTKRAERFADAVSDKELIRIARQIGGDEKGRQAVRKVVLLRTEPDASLLKAAERAKAYMQIDEKTARVFALRKD